MRPPTQGSASTVAGETHHPTTHAKPDVDVDAQIHRFFTRNGLDPGPSRQACDDYAVKLLKGETCAPVARQGYCSYTLIMGQNRLVLQFRPPAYRCNEAHVHEILESLRTASTKMAAPMFTGEQVECPALGGKPDEPAVKVSPYVMPVIPGIPLDQYLDGRVLSDAELFKVRKTLVEDMACIFVRAWGHAVEARTFRDFGHPLKVGSSLRQRLAWLRQLPGDDLKGVVAQAERDLAELELASACCTHGDLIPANIMVDEKTGKLTGLIDWAECEILPLGVGLYGLEEILGHTDPRTGRFAYHPLHRELRQHFYATFEALRRDNGDRFDESDLRTLKLGRRLGILLWRGIAWDDGRLDRVVEEGRVGDAADLHKLRLFLSVDDPIPSAWGARLRSIWRDRENVATQPRLLLFNRPRAGGEDTIPLWALTMCHMAEPHDPVWHRRSGPEQSDRRVFKFA